MDEVLVRIALVGSALAVAFGASLAIRRRSQGKPAAVAETGLTQGIYLFTSSACQGCNSARRTLIDAVGEEGFVEVNWETLPGEFHRLGVSAVPATLKVVADGSGVLYPGQPGDMLKDVRSLNGN